MINDIRQQWTSPIKGCREVKIHLLLPFIIDINTYLLFSSVDLVTEVNFLQRCSGLPFSFILPGPSNKLRCLRVTLGK